MTAETKVVVGDITVQARDAWYGWGKHPIMPNDEIVMLRGGTPEAFAVYDELERDAKVAELLQKRKLALLSREWVVEPASKSAADQYAADLVRAQLEALGYDRVSGYLLDAIMKGAAFVEPIYDRVGREIVCVDALQCEPWLLSFNIEAKPEDLIVNRHALRLRWPDKAEGEPIPPMKMMVHTNGGRYNNPWGLGLGNKLFWPVFFKRQGLQFWLAFCERFGTPVPWGEYPANATPEQRNTLRLALKAFAQEGIIMTPQGMSIKLLEATRSGSASYLELVHYLDGQIGGIVLGKSGAPGSGGQLATAIQVENEVRLELTKGDADLLDAAVSNQLVRWLVDLNKPGAGYPRVKRVITEPIDTKATAETMKTVFDMGFRPSLQQIQDAFGMGWTQAPAGPNTDPAKSAAMSTATTDSDAKPAFAAVPAADKTAGAVEPAPSPPLPGPQPDISGLKALDSAVAALPATQLDAQMQAILSPLLQALRETTDLEGAQAVLDGAAGIIDTQPLAEALASTGFAAYWMGLGDGV